MKIYEQRLKNKFKMNKKSKLIKELYKEYKKNPVKITL